MVNRCLLSSLSLLEFGADVGWERLKVSLDLLSLGLDREALVVGDGGQVSVGLKRKEDKMCTLINDQSTQCY